MSSYPRDAGNLAEVLVFEPSARVNVDAALPEAPTQAHRDADAAKLQARLAEQVPAGDQPRPKHGPAFKPAWDLPGDALKPETIKATAAKAGKIRRIIKTLIALAAVVVLGWTPLQRSLQTTSSEAIVNARLVTVRAPIDGTVTVPHDITGVGETINSDEQLLRITNPRADRSQLDDLRRQISGLQAECDALERRKTQLEGLQGQLRQQRDAFQKGRVEQLEARVAELAAGISAADAKEEETNSTLDRANRLMAKGYQTEAALDRAERDQKVAANTVEALRQQLTGTKVELDAAKRGLFVGDSYNDIPRTAQRLDEITQEVIDLEGQIDEKTLRISQLQADLAQEEKPSPCARRRP
jgi:multidrug resistance efflux pump